MEDALVSLSAREIMCVVTTKSLPDLTKVSTTPMTNCNGKGESMPFIAVVITSRTSDISLSTEAHQPFPELEDARINFSTIEGSLSSEMISTSPIEKARRTAVWYEPDSRIDAVISRDDFFSASNFSVEYSAASTGRDTACSVFCFETSRIKFKNLSIAYN